LQPDVNFSLTIAPALPQRQARPLKNAQHTSVSRVHDGVKRFNLVSNGRLPQHLKQMGANALPLIPIIDYKSRLGGDGMGCIFNNVVGQSDGNFLLAAGYYGHDGCALALGQIHNKGNVAHGWAVRAQETFEQSLV
jgi:hypothetical protein